MSISPLEVSFNIRPKMSCKFQKNICFHLNIFFYISPLVVGLSIRPKTSLKLQKNYLFILNNVSKQIHWKRKKEFLLNFNNWRALKTGLVLLFTIHNTSFFTKNIYYDLNIQTFVLQLQKSFITRDLYNPGPKETMGIILAVVIEYFWDSLAI